jgi:hypothetical protein
MHEQTGEGMRHDLTPLYGATAAGICSQRLTPWAIVLRPSGLKQSAPHSS